MWQRPSSVPRSLADDQKIAGWPALLALGVVLSSLVSLVLAASFAVDLIGALGREDHPRFEAGSAALATVLAVQGAWGLTCFRALMARKRRAISLVLSYSGLLLLVLVLADPFSPLPLVPEGGATRVTSSFHSSLIAPAFWIPYTLFSKRVRRTFVL